MQQLKSYFSPAPPAAKGTTTPSPSHPKPMAPSARWSTTSTTAAAANPSAAILRDMRADVTAAHLYAEQMKRSLASPTCPTEGVVLKKSRGVFVCAPASLEASSLHDQIALLNVGVAITVNTPLVRSVLAVVVRSAAESVPLPNGQNLQVLARMGDLARCQKHHFAAFVLDAGLLVVWDDDPRHVLVRAGEVSEAIMRMVWGEEEEEADEKGDGEGEGDLEEGGGERRAFCLLSSWAVMGTMVLALSALGTGYRALALQSATDGEYSRLALAVTSPLALFVGLVSVQTSWLCFGLADFCSSSSSR